MAKRDRGLTEREIGRLVAEYRARQGTRAEFCRRQGVSEYAMDYYLRREKQGKILPDEIDGAGADYTVAIVLGNGRRVEIQAPLDATAVARLVRTLEHE